MDLLIKPYTLILHIQICPECCAFQIIWISLDSSIHSRRYSQHNYVFWRFADRASQYIYLSNWPTWCTIFLFYNKFISCLYMFRAHYTASGIIAPIMWWYQRLCYAVLTSWWWAHVLETCRGMKYTYCKQTFCASSWLITEINNYVYSFLSKQHLFL